MQIGKFAETCQETINILVMGLTMILSHALKKTIALGYRFKVTFIASVNKTSLECKQNMHVQEK